jgi:hypothetical protein
MADAIDDREAFKTGGGSGAGDDIDEKDLPCQVAAHHVFFDRARGAPMEEDATSASVHTPIEVVTALRSCVGDLLRLLTDEPSRVPEEEHVHSPPSLYSRRRGVNGPTAAEEATATAHAQDRWLLLSRVVGTWFRERFVYKGVVRPTGVVGQLTIAVGGPTPSYNLWPDADVTETLYLSILLVPNLCLSADGEVAISAAFLQRVPGVLHAHTIDTARFVGEEGYRSHFSWIIAAMTERQLSTYARENPRMPCAHQRVGVMLKRPVGPTMQPYRSAGPTILHPGQEHPFHEPPSSGYCLITLK